MNAGISDDNTLYAYDSSGENYHGPRTAIDGLPTTSQWSNVSLKNTIRSILNENGGNTTTGGTLPSNFSYSGYAARLLTIQEVRYATKNQNIPTFETGELDDFTYLLEKTRFANDINGWAYWFESTSSGSENNSYYVSGFYRNNNIYLSSNSGGNVGVRPVIEVLKTNIEY